MLNPNVTPLAQDFTIAARVPDPNLYFFHDPNLARLDDGTLIVAAPQWGRRHTNLGRSVRIVRSTDGGQTWTDLPTLPYQEGRPFVVDGRLLMFVQERSHGDFQIVASDDRGETWTEPRTVIPGPIWNISTSQVVRPDALYWAMDRDSAGVDYKGKVMVRWDRTRSALDPDAWSISNVVPPPEIPASLTRGLFPVDNRPQVYLGWPSPFVWLEPNTVEVAGRIRVFVRAIIDENATANIAAVLDYDEAANKLSFIQFTAWPGGQCKFFILHDQPNRTYWMLSNLVTNSQDLLGWGHRMRETGFTGGPGNERRWLFLHYSVDCLNWFPAGCVARWPDSVHRSFMYPSAAIDGDDLVILSRTSRYAQNQHDADLCTIHRIPNFRTLAMDLHRGGLTH